MNNPSRIMIVDDEPKMVRLLSNIFTTTGFKVISCSNPEMVPGMVALEEPDLVIMDIMFPGTVDGCKICQQIREYSSVPIIMLTAKVRDADKLDGFASGADDYVTKPFNSKELVARVRALLKRAHAAGEMEAPAEIDLGRLHIDQAARKVTVNGLEVHLTPTEFTLLSKLAQHHDQVMTHEQLLTAIWGQDFIQDNEYLRSFIYTLRKKIESDPSNPQLIKRYPGIGYSLISPVEDPLNPR